MPVLAGCGAAVLYRREAFAASGGLDSDFFAYLDDLDLALAGAVAGIWRTIPAERSCLSHRQRDAWAILLHPRVIEYITRNQIYLLTKDYPQPVFVRLLPRIVLYQCLWLVFALRNSSPGAYFRGLMARLRGRRAMRQKHRDLIARQRISRRSEFLERLRDSERQVYGWHQSRPPQERSALLKIYFRLFGRP